LNDIFARHINEPETRKNNVKRHKGINRTISFSPAPKAKYPSVIKKPIKIVANSGTINTIALLVDIVLGLLHFFK
jgi:hypothetical protein